MLTFHGQLRDGLLPDPPCPGESERDGSAALILNKGTFPWRQDEVAIRPARQAAIGGLGARLTRPRGIEIDFCAIGYNGHYFIERVATGVELVSDQTVTRWKDEHITLNGLWQG